MSAAETVAVVFSVLGIIIACVGAGIAFAARGDSRRSASAAERSADAAERSADTAERSAMTSERSAVAAESSSSAADRSARAAEEPLSLQEREFESQEQDRRRAQQANVVALWWDGSITSHQRGLPTGLVVVNNGPGVATDLFAEVEPPYRAERLPSLAADARFGFVRLPETKPELPSEFVEESPETIPRAEGKYAARIHWTNEDGKPSSTGWVLVEKRQ